MLQFYCLSQCTTNKEIVKRHSDSHLFHCLLVKEADNSSLGLVHCSHERAVCRIGVA